MTETRDFEFFLTVDADGDFEVGVTHDDALERYGDNIGGSIERRTYRMLIALPLPAAKNVTITSVDTSEPVAGGVYVQTESEGS